MRRRNGDFNPHLPRGRWRYHTGQNPDAGAISIHTFLAEGDRRLYIWLHTLMNFNPHLPRGRWQSIFQRLQWQMWFQSTPSSRKVTPCSPSERRGRAISIHTFLAEGDPRSHPRPSPSLCISIHTFLAEGDGALDFMDEFHVPISIHTFLAEGDSRKCRASWWQRRFQSTPSSRKVTEEHSRDTVRNNNFNPHLPRGRWL